MISMPSGVLDTTFAGTEFVKGAEGVMTAKTSNHDNFIT
jgi:hypothetical protein